MGAIEKKKATSAEHLRRSVTTNLIELADAAIEDIESGIEDGTYEDDEENAARLKELEEMREEAIALKDYRPAIYIMVEGGNVQGASATEDIDFNLWDSDNHEADEAQYEADNGTPAEWEAKLKAGEEEGTIIGIY